MLYEAYEKIGYKKLMLVPVIIFLICLGFLFIQNQKTGEYVAKGIDLEGGAQLSFDINKDVNIQDLESYLRNDFGDIDVRKAVSVGGSTILIRTKEIDEEEMVSALEEYGFDMSSYSFQEIGASLGEAFFSQSITAVLIALFFMGIVVFFVFRNLIPSLAVIFAAISDILGTLGIMQFLGIELSLASFAGLLMVIGYSIDTDILLTTRILKRREGELKERISSTLKTGITMSGTTLAALFALFFASGSSILQEISAVLIIALLLDLPNTYMMNLGVLRWWMEKRKIK